MWNLGPRDKSDLHVPDFEADWKKAVDTWRRKYVKIRKLKPFSSRSF